MSLTENGNGNGFYMPVSPAYNSGNGFGGFGNDWGSLIVLFLIAAMFGGFGNGFGGYGAGNNVVNTDFPWLLNGQNAINANTDAGFNNLAVQNGISSVQNGINGLSNQICNSTAAVNQTLNNGFANAETSANARQMANMNQSFANQTAMNQGFNNIQSQLANCCCENRLATCQTQNIVQNESNATRFADANNTRDIITNATQNTQAILDKLCQLELDGVKAQLEAKNDLIGQLRQENLYARGQASQVAQTAELRTAQATTANQLVNELRSCPIPSQPVYGNQPIFNCSPSWRNTGCGCNGNF
jgi:hypothetical protein